MRSLSWILVACSFASTAIASPVTGIFTAVVSEATSDDSDGLAFGRIPSDWIGRTVSGTFTYDVDTPKIVDSNSAPDSWNYEDPSRSTKWVTVKVTIDGVAFETHKLAFTFGNVVIADNGYFGSDWFGPQDAYAIVGGRSVIGFDVFGGPGLFSYSGTGGAVQFGSGSPNFTSRPNGEFGSGLVEELQETGGMVVLHDTIRFQLTGLTVGDIGSLLQQLRTSVTGIGPGNSLANKLALAETYYAVPDVQSTCAVLTDFLNQVAAQSGKKITADQATGLAANVSALMLAIPCE